MTDNLTGLIWLKHANCFGARTWEESLLDCNGLSAGWCGLTDGSNPGDWRLPNYKELFSLLDAENYDPPLPSGHPFTNVQSYFYWASTSGAHDGAGAWNYDMRDGQMIFGHKSNGQYVWPVRGGH